MKKYLRCLQGGGGFIAGKRYEIVEETECLGEMCYVVFDDEGSRNYFSIEPDREGLSYRDWFTLEIDEEPRKIDGRKAEIIDRGSFYTTYQSFADEHGYPDAAVERDDIPSTRTPKEGTVVTLLTSGRHACGESVLWIVETSDKKRFIINEKGLRILSEEITVLKDESLGGIEREHREVKRKTSAGEIVKITDDTSGHWFPIGEIVRKTASNCAEYLDGHDFWYINECDYVALEPTDIIRIDDPDGVNRGYRMVDRKAAVGERVIAVSKTHTENDGTDVMHRIGEFGTVSARGKAYKNRIKINGYFVVDGDYRVLEPVEGEKAPALSAQSPLDQAAANISALTAKVQALESRVDVLEKAQAAGVKVAEGPADEAPPSFATPTGKTPQQIRDAVVERAKADVRELLDRNYPMAAGYRPSIWFTNKDGSYVTDKCEFVVNRDKRTVVALISEIGGRTFRKGIAKAAPNDVFNAHIGRAIALRRALGLEVPAEYLNVPNPEEPRVGDVVAGGRPNTFYSPDKRFTLTADRGDGSFKYAERPTDWIEPGQIGAIIDDSREEVGA